MLFQLSSSLLLPVDTALSSPSARARVSQSSPSSPAERSRAQRERTVGSSSSADPAQRMKAEERGGSSRSFSIAFQAPILSI